jgi:hypothetical protein
VDLDREGDEEGQHGRIISRAVESRDAGALGVIRGDWTKKSPARVSRSPESFCMIIQDSATPAGFEPADQDSRKLQAWRGLARFCE